MEKSLIIIDAGHGEETAGKRSPVWSDGRQLLEYQFNRSIAHLLLAMLVPSTFDVLYLNGCDPKRDLPLSTRVGAANKSSQNYRKSLFISIHGNAAGTQSAKGIEVFTSKGETKSDKVATLMLEQLEKYLPTRKFRFDYSDGDKDKEENFYVLSKTRMPAVLLELGFYTNEEECRLMLSMEYKYKCAEAILVAIAGARLEGLI